MTQAMAAAETLEHQGHRIVAVTIGTNPGRTIPEFFRGAFEIPLTPLASPGFSLRGGRGVATLGTLRQAVAGLGAYYGSLRILGGLIEQAQPDVIVNFLEPLMGVFNLIRPHPTPVISVGHHFMLGHPAFVRSRRFLLQQWSMRRYVRLAGAGSTHLALSFYPAAALPQRRLVVCPPLLRRELFALPQDVPGGFLLVYVLNQGYTSEVLRWHAARPDIELHCFCERPKIEPVWRYDATLSFHKLDGAKFLRMMSASRGVACTAGFESLNEAAWLGKPLLVVPVENHVEQHLNALDAQKAGLAVAAKGFDLTPLLHCQPPAHLAAYRAWVERAGAVFLSVIEGARRSGKADLLPGYAEPIPHHAG
jgi:uncharacterized protein (TIGR00661 family)